MIALSRWHRLDDYQPRLSRHSTQRRTGVAIVHLPGLTNDGDLTVSDLLPVYLRYGDAFVLNHPRLGYAPEEAVNQIIDAICQEYHTVVLVASSMGGRLVAPIIEAIEAEWLPITVKVWWQCGLLSGRDAAGPAKLLSNVCVWPIATAPVIRVFDYLVGLRDKLPVEAGVDRGHLDGHRRALRGAHRTGRRAQLRYIAESGLPQGVYDVESVYTQACQVDGRSDGFVRGSAAESVREFFPQTEVHVRSDLRHTTLVEQPAAWISEAYYVFDRLNLLPAD